MNISKIGVVILNYGYPSKTIELAASLHQKEKSAVIIIVDNFSSDQNLRLLQEFIADQSSQLYLIENNFNDGYGAGNNLGFKLLFEELLCDASIAINPDITLDPNFSFDSIRSIKWEEEVLFTGLVNQHGLEYSTYQFNSFIFSSKPLGLVGSTGDYPKYISGCFWGMSKEMWFRFGGFSTSYFLYFEELDFIYRYKLKKGFFPNIYEFKNMKVTHQMGGTTGSSSDKTLSSSFSDYWSSRSRIIFAKTHIRKYIVNALFYNILKAFLMIYHLRLRNALNIVKGTIDGLFSQTR